MKTMKVVTIVMLPPAVCFGLFLTLWPGWRCGARSVSVSAMSTPLPSEPLLSTLIERERRKWGLPKGVIEGLIMVESKFDETAANPESKSKCYRSAKTKAEKQRCGSRGLMQIVGRWHGGEGDSLSQHVARGTAILGRHFRRYGKISKAVAAYNGSGPMARQYARRVIKEAERFGFNG